MAPRSLHGLLAPGQIEESATFDTPQTEPRPHKPWEATHTTPHILTKQCTRAQSSSLYLRWQYSSFVEISTPAWNACAGATSVSEILFFTPPPSRRLRKLFSDRWSSAKRTRDLWITCTFIRPQAAIYYTSAILRLWPPFLWAKYVMIFIACSKITQNVGVTGRPLRVRRGKSSFNVNITSLN